MGRLIQTKDNANSKEIKAETVEKKCLALDELKGVELTEDTMKTPVGPRRVSYLKIEGVEKLVPITLTDYQSTQLMEKICHRHTKNKP